uniref:Uncharacterized protein n=1 Tax=Anguilla anguilla TaxID=7936 RepID=A0A0E9XKH8_ANGAN
MHVTLPLNWPTRYFP